ncbi:hypothetical protein T492DRAFT_843424 [Pavlovales sp. CCMP2436]|nr:hypothetical protein T492DRAFT_843424 [Pavlovales sp. CCMP2436]
MRDCLWPALEVSALTFSENGYHLAGATEDGTVKVWDLRKLSLLTTISGARGGAASVSFDSSAQYLAIGGPGAGLRAVSAKTWEVLCAAPDVQGLVSVGWAADALALVGATSDNQLVALSP